jgi:hypothetical protein
MTRITYARPPRVARSTLNSLRSFSLFAATAAVICLVARGARCADRPTLNGVWNAGPLTERWNVGDWGKACGPRPAPHDQPGGQVNVREEAGEIAMSGMNRTYRTTECWEQLPGVTRTTHSAADHAWKTQCKSAPNDPRQTTIVTTLTATDTTITLDETGEYQFRIEGQNCTASTRRTRSFTLFQREGQAPPSVATAPPQGVQPAPTSAGIPTTRGEPLGLPATPPATARAAPSGRCASPGEPARLEVRPVRKWLAPGQRFTFRAVALDAEGCAVDARITWTLADPDAKVTVMPGGTVAVADDAGDGTIQLNVSFAGRSVPVYIEVASPARFEALLSAGSIPDAGEGDEAATIVASGGLGANPAVAKDGARSRKTTFVVIIGGLALGLAALGFVLLRRGVLGPTAVAPPADDGEPDDADEPPGAAGFPVQGVVVSQGRPVPGRPVVCPSCRNEFPPGSVFCPHDGNRLVAAPLAPAQGPTPSAGGVCPTCGRGYDPGIKTCPEHGDDLVPVPVYRATAQRAAVATERGKICPSCGGRYGGQATFCGKDGTALVLVN